MKLVYPIIITKTDDKKVPYLIKIPALNGLTQGTTIENSIQMARDYIGLNILDRQDDQEPIPESVYQLPVTQSSEITTLIDVDIDEYRRKNDLKVVKKTLTIPNYLNKLGQDNHINFSELLTNALKEKLGI